MSRYAAAHANPQGPGDARPTAMQIVKDNDMEGKLVGKTAVVTGISSGIGVETVRALAATGVTLILTARDLEKARSALGAIFDDKQMHLVHMDQSSLASVRAAAADILALTDKISLLVANAAVMAVQQRELTADGYEMQFATNHLSHFLLFQLLKPALLAGSTPDFHSRVVLVGASAHRIQGINEPDNYNWEKGGYAPWTAYAQSKTANTYTAAEIERRYGARGLHATSPHPGNIHTGLIRHLPQAEVEAMGSNPQFLPIIKSTEQGAATTLVAAIGKEWEGRGGKYLADCEEAPAGQDDGNIVSTATSSVTYNPEKAAQLWTDSLRMVGLSADEE